ncbi:MULTISPECIES: hypothetical protein [unclassified Streptomyces]|uniref:hypothetical protein n=1 Tax=unclassified Streptomyces TaxID=2593676 RepID=UPI000851B0A7|nr:MULTISPECIES: hypothetical protein [unclassified Streptomyces]
MARLQILELPSGPGDDRPPFILVVDECVPQRIALGADDSYGDYWQALADRIGARGVIVTPETMEIPGNASLPLAEMEARPAQVRVYLGDKEINEITRRIVTDVKQAVGDGG